jgi:NTE family protein
MEYTFEEVQPLKDDSTQPTDDTNPISLEGNGTQPNEEAVPNSAADNSTLPNLAADSVSPENESTQSNEEADSISQENGTNQLNEEADILSYFQGNESNQPAEGAAVVSASPQEDTLQPTDEIDSTSNIPEQSFQQPADAIDLNSILPEDSNPQSQVESITISEPLEAGVERHTKKIALILSGGGARGAFQVGAEKYARDVKGYHWDIIAGVSVGALNGAMLAMHRYGRLLDLWDNISDSQVYTGGFNLISLIKLIFGAKSFYGYAPLQKLMQQEFEAGRIIDDLHVGAVSLITGEYVQFTKESLELARAILASTSIPVVWPPVDVSSDRLAMVDGGVRNLTPVGDVLDLEPDEIVIINCGSEQPPVLPSAPANVLSIGMRALDIMQNEIFLNDMNEFLRINTLVQEAEKQGCLLHSPKSGRLLKYYPYQIIEPDRELGGVLDFSQISIQAAIKAGVRRAREVLGRP